MKKSKKGFTLVELIIVIAVIGVLAAILIPVFANVIEKANAKSALSDARNTVEELTVESEDYLDMPEQIVIFVKKGGKIYAFGFDRASGGELQISNGNSHEFRGYTDIATLNADYGNHTMFYLVPASDTTSGIRGIPMRDVQPGMGDYTDVLETYCASERIGQDNVAVYKGILEDGTWYYEDHMQISGVNGGNTSTNGNTGNDPVTPTL